MSVYFLLSVVLCDASFEDIQLILSGDDDEVWLTTLTIGDTTDTLSVLLFNEANLNKLSTFFFFFFVFTSDEKEKVAPFSFPLRFSSLLVFFFALNACVCVCVCARSSWWEERKRKANRHTRTTVMINDLLVIWGILQDNCCELTLQTNLFSPFIFKVTFLLFVYLPWIFSLTIDKVTSIWFHFHPVDQQHLQ